MANLLLMVIPRLRLDVPDGVIINEIEMVPDISQVIFIFDSKD
jgi:hypothetical protein